MFHRLSTGIVWKTQLHHQQPVEQCWRQYRVADERQQGSGLRVHLIQNLIFGISCGLEKCFNLSVLLDFFLWSGVIVAHLLCDDYMSLSPRDIHCIHNYWPEHSSTGLAFAVLMKHVTHKT